MKRLFAAVALAIPMLVAATGPASAVDDQQAFSIASTRARPDYESTTAGARYYFGGEPHPGIVRRIDSNVTTSQTTTRFHRTTEDACQWALMSALVRLRASAERNGGNAAINIRSNANNIETTSRTEFQCIVGRGLVRVSLKADIVQLR